MLLTGLNRARVSIHSILRARVADNTLRNFSFGRQLDAKNKTKKSDLPSKSAGFGGETPIDFDKAAVEGTCSSVVARLQKELQDIKAGRQNPAVLNNLKIASENTILSSLATVTQKNTKTFIVTVYDPMHVKAVSSAIAGSGQNLNPQPVPNNPAQLTISIPKDSASAKAEKVKALGQKAEQARTQIRGIRGDALKKIKNSLSSKDEQKRDEKTVGSIIERFSKEIDLIAKKDTDL